MPEFLTVEEAAQRYHTTPGALFTQRYRGEAPGVLAIKVGRRLLWSVADLQSWEESQKAERPVAVAS